MKHYETVKVEIADKVAKVILNRPDKKNAMNPQLHRDMTQVLEDLRYDDSAAVLVITGAGNAFCAGMDLKEFFHDLKLANPAEYDRITRLAVEWRGRTLRYYPKPTVAMINGFCFGGAFSIVEGTDLAIPPDRSRGILSSSLSSPTAASRSRTDAAISVSFIRVWRRSGVKPCAAFGSAPLMRAPTGSRV